MTTPLGSISNDIIARLEILSVARDHALSDGRQLVRLSANAIRAVHRGEYPEAELLLDQAQLLLTEMVESLRDHPNLYWQGYVQDPMKEYAEARLTLAFVRGETLPSPSELGVEDAPYLNALAEAASELRREVLDTMRNGDLSRAETLLALMERAYDVLVTIDFPDGMTNGLRRTTDQLRAVLERTRNDLTLTLTQDRLSRAIREAEATFRGQPNRPDGTLDQDENAPRSTGVPAP